MSQRKIFLIEDNRTEGMLLKLALSSLENVLISSFDRGQDLINSLSQNPDIVIVDLVLPDIAGFDLIKLILEHNSETRIVVVSGQKDFDMIADIQALGVYNYLVKSEGCIVYLQKVIQDLLIVIDYHKNQKSKPQ